MAGPGEILMPTLKEEMEALKDFFQNNRKLRPQEAILVMLNEIPYFLGFDEIVKDGTIRFTDFAGKQFPKEPPKPD